MGSCFGSVVSHILSYSFLGSVEVQPISNSGRPLVYIIFHIAHVPDISLFHDASSLDLSYVRNQGANILS